MKQLRLQYLAREEQAAAGGDRVVLDDMRRQLQGLRDAVAAPAPDARVPARPFAVAMGAGRDDVRRLLEQRAVLLRTGMYAPDDPVLRALDSEIQGAMAAVEANG